MSYIGQGLPADTFQGFTTDSFTGDGSATTFTLSKEPFSEDTLIVVINNVIQKPTANFTVSGTTLTIVGTAVASGDVVYAIHMGGPLPIGGAAELDLNGASDKLILDADGDTTISADTDDQIDFKVGGVDEVTMSSSGIVINEGSNDRDFRIESNGKANMFFVDGGNDRIGINTAGQANHLVNIEDVTNNGGGTLGLTVSTSGTSDNLGRLHFGNATDPVLSAVFGIADGANDAGALTFRTEASGAALEEALRINSSRKLSTTGETGPDCDPGGLCLNHGANDNLILTAKSSDVAHGRTSYAETDTYFTIAKAQAAGGASITSSNGTSSAYSLFLNGHASGEDTTKSTSGIGPVIVTHRTASGTSFLSVGSNANMFVVQNASSTKFIVDAEGDIHYDGSASAYDSYNDAHLVRAFDQTMSPKAVIQSEFDKFVEYKKDDLVKAGLLGDVSQEKIDEGEKPLVCLTGMQRLHNGAIWQQYEKHQKLAEAVYEMAKETLGQDKADAILEKHDIKLLN